MYQGTLIKMASSSAFYKEASRVGLSKAGVFKWIPV